MKIAIVTDSNSGISQQEAKDLNISIIPMPFLIDGEEYFEDITLSQEEFYRRLQQGAEVSTSQPSIFAVGEVWDELLKTHDAVVHIPMSGGLSASVDTAKKYAEQYDGKVQVVDNHRISVTQKQSVFDALKLAEMGKTAVEIKEILEKDALQASIYIMVTTLKYLKKGGRITPVAAALGSLLKIKPVLQIQGDKLDKFCQVITEFQGKKRMIAQMKEDIKNRFSDLLKDNKLGVYMAYTNCKEKCLEFKKEAEKELAEFGLKIEYVDPLSLSVASHIGDGAIAIACAKKL